MPKVFVIMDNILGIGYDDNDDNGTDHDATVHKVLQRYEEVYLKLNKEKCHFRCTSIPFFAEVILRRGAQPDPQKKKKNQSPHRHTSTKQQERAPGVPGNY